MGYTLAENKYVITSYSIHYTKLYEISEFKFDLAYKKIELGQAKYESTSYQRKKNSNVLYIIPFLDQLE